MAEKAPTKHLLPVQAAETWLSSGIIGVWLGLVMSNVGYTGAAPRSIVDRNMKIDNANYRVFPRPGLCLASARHANQLDIEEIYDLLLSSPLLQLEDVSLIFFFPLDIMNPLFSFLADKILNYVSTS